MKVYYGPIAIFADIVLAKFHVNGIVSTASEATARRRKGSVPITHDPDNSTVSILLKAIR